MGLIIRGLTTEFLTDPMGLDVKKPRFGWKLSADRRGAGQTAYRILVASSEANLANGIGDMWDSGIVGSDRTAHIAYDGKPVVSGGEYVWKATVWDEDGKPAAWSETARWSVGLLTRAEWKGKWVGLKSPHQPTALEPKPAIYLRGEFRTEAGKPVRKAILSATALGGYELYVNGSQIGDQVLNPEWTDFNIRVQYQTYDVTNALNAGDNAIAVLLGHGWFSGFIGMFGYHRYGTDPRVLIQLNVDYEDGTRQSVATDRSWKASFGALQATDFHMGETYDARLETPGWQAAGFDDAEWRQADVFYDYKGHFNGVVMPPVRQVMELRPVSLTRMPGGHYIADMGQNLVGRVRLRVRGEAGMKITLRHGEALDPNKELYTENLRLSRQVDTFILKDSEEYVYEPHFTLHGFRYVEISGYSGTLSSSDLTAVVVHSDLTLTGKLETSDSLLNRLLANIEWTQRGNFISVPTDCPQRDERLGWSGDAQVFIRTATYFMDVEPFFTKWMTDLTDAQRPTGAFTDFAPFFPGAKTAHGGDMTYDHTASAGWGDAGTIVPWTLYQVYGDKQIIERHYDAMAKWIAFLEEMHPAHLHEDLPQYGDWLSLPEKSGPADFANVSANSSTPYDVYATAYNAHSVELMAKMAALLGRTEDAAKYTAHFEAVRAAFNRAYVDAEKGRIKGDTQSIYALAVSMNLLSDEMKTAAVKRIVELLEANDWHMTTGIHGTKYLLTVLVESGHEDIAYRLLTQRSYPSWNYSILQGATTIWERWDGWTEERGFQRPGMNSFNHYALGAVGEWIYKYVGGIDLDPAQPGYKHIRIQPRIGGGLEHASCRYDSIRGPIACNWRASGGKLTLDVEIPANTTASVRIPLQPGQSVRESGNELSAAEGVSIATESQRGAIVLEIASGIYRFEVE